VLPPTLLDEVEDAPPSTAPVTVRRLLIPGLLIVWGAVTVRLWIDPAAPACEYPDFPPDACAAEEEALARKSRWLGPVFLSGPILALAAVTPPSTGSTCWKTHI
jgi:hypothetical protein